MYARALIDELNRRDGPWLHEMVSIFEPERERPTAEHSVNVPRGPLRDLGLDPRAIYGLRRVVRRLSPDLVVAHGGESAKYLSLGGASGRPYVYLAIGSAHPLLKHRGRRALHRHYTGRASMVVAVSRFVASEILEMTDVGPERVEIIHNGRDKDAFVPASRERAEGDAARAIFVGRMEGQKRPDWFIDAIRAVRQEGHAAEGIMVGAGPLIAELEPFARENGVKMLGRRDDVPDLMSSADFLIMTSRPPEGMPGVLIEAGLSGLPAIATDVPGARDVIDDGVTGLIVDTDDQEALIDAVRRMISDDEMRAKMGEAARTRCCGFFSLEASADRWEAVLARFE